MICKKCGKEFNSENNICTFCNHDNNVEENVQPTETSAPAETPAPVAETPTTETTPVETPAAETPAAETAPVETPVETTPAPAAPAVPAEPEVEDLFDDEKKEEPASAEIVIEEPAKTEEAAPAETPAPAATPAAETTPVETPAAETPVETTAAPEVTPAQTEETAAPAAEAQPTETPAAPADATTTEVTTPEEPQKSKISGKTIAMLVLIVILVVVVVIMYLPKGEEEPTPEPTPSEQTPATNDQTNNNNGNENNQNQTATDVFSFSGVYKNGDVKVTMYASSSTTVSFTVETAGDYDMADLELVNNNLVCEDEWFGDTTSIRVVKTAEGIQLTASSTDAESVLNKITGVYTKESSVNSTWAGVYKNSNFQYTIDQIVEGELTLSYSNEDGTYSGNFEGIEDFTETTITYEGVFGDKFVITKTATGISVVATSTDAEDDMTALNGEFTKAK